MQLQGQIAELDRLRRIKCDEFKPTCKRCSSTGRQCGGVGYTEGVHNSEPITPTSETLAMSRSPESTPLSSPTIYLPSLHSLQLAQERRSFQFFTDRTVIDIANGLDTKFWHNWKRHLLQAAYHEPAVRHAAVALAALHEQFELGERSDLETGLINCDNQFALQQYVTAIGLLRNPIRKKKGKIADVALITCILFVCFEVSCQLPFKIPCSQLSATSWSSWCGHRSYRWRGKHLE